MNYSRFIMCLNRSNIVLDRKVLADLAVNEPYSFKSVIDEVKKQASFVELEAQKPKLTKQRGMLFAEALDNGRLRAGGPPSEEELREIQASLLPPKLDMFGLRYPERDAKTKADHMRLSYKEEDEQFMADQELKTITVGEQKKLPREVLTDNWEEDMSLYKHKRKP